MTLTEAVSSGDRLATLTALRDALADRLEVCTSDQNYSIMSRVLLDVLAQLADLGDAGAATVKEATALDEFTKRLQERESAPKPPRRTKGT